MKKFVAIAVVAAACASASADVVTVFPVISPLTQGFAQPLQILAGSYNSTDLYIDNFTNFTFGNAFVTAYVNFFPGKIMTTGGFSTTGYAFAKKLAIGDTVGPATFGTANFNPMFADEHYGQGQWFNGTQPVEGFFGLAYANGFDGGGNALVNYAYVDLRVTPLPGQSAVVDILGWGVETTPNTAVTVAQLPEPTFVGVLGLAAIAGIRRRRA